jgi:hypothetical protein
MRHPFYPGRDDANAVTASLLGYLDFEPACGRVRPLRLVTGGAVYAGMPFGAALRSLEAAAPAPEDTGDRESAGRP